MTHTPRRRWFRFSLRSALIAMAVLSAAVGYVAHEWRIVRERERAAELALRSNPGKAEHGLTRSWAALNRVSWVRRALGDHSTEQVFLWSGEPPPAVLKRLRAAYPEAEIKWRNDP